MRAESFVATRHGAAHYALDRTSLFIAGSLSAWYPANSMTAFLFAVMFVRCVINDCDAALKFFFLWRKSDRGLFSPDTYAENVALKLVTEVWDPAGHRMGYTFRMTPQNHLGPGHKGTGKELGCSFTGSVAVCLQRMPHAKLPWYDLK